MNQLCIWRNRLSIARHVCGFFHTREEEYRVVMPFIQEGSSRGSRFTSSIRIHRADPVARPNDRTDITS